MRLKCVGTIDLMISPTSSTLFRGPINLRVRVQRTTHMTNGAVANGIVLARRLSSTCANCCGLFLVAWVILTTQMARLLPESISSLCTGKAR